MFISKRGGLQAIRAAADTVQEWVRGLAEEAVCDGVCGEARNCGGISAWVFRVLLESLFVESFAPFPPQ
jgi:hypothetical protein